MANFDAEYGTFLSKEIGDKFYGGSKILGSVDGSYHASQSFGGIAGEKLLYNASDNKRYTMGKVMFFSNNYVMLIINVMQLIINVLTTVELQFHCTER